jgi:hypothetical protein
MNASTKAAGALAAVLLVAQGVASLAIPPSKSNSYSGTTGDIVNDTLFAVGLLALCGFLGQVRGARWSSRGDVAAAAGCGLLAAATLATVIAGHEVWEVPFVLGFLACEVGWLVALAAGRAFPRALLLVGMVLALAFFDSAGSIVLGLGVLFQLRVSAELATA